MLWAGRRNGPAAETCRATGREREGTVCYGVTLPSAATSNARPGSMPLPGVSTTRLRSVPLADTPSVLAPVGFTAQVLGSLMRIRCSDPTGTSAERDLPAVRPYRREGERLKTAPTRVEVCDVHALHTLAEGGGDGRIRGGRRHVAKYDRCEPLSRPEPARIVAARKKHQQHPNHDEPRRISSAYDLHCGASPSSSPWYLDGFTYTRRTPSAFSMALRAGIRVSTITLSRSTAAGSTSQARSTCQS